MLPNHHKFCRGWVLTLLVALGLGLSLPAPVQAQKKKRGLFDKTEVPLKNNPKFLEAFRPVVARASASTVRVQCDGDDRALGVVVSADGFILTQLHDLNGKITVKLKDGDDLDAEIVTVHNKFDLALLKIDATDLKPVAWGDSKQAPVGNWVASVGTGQDPVAVGVVGVAARPNIPKKLVLGPKSGYLGVGLEDNPLGAKIGFVEPKGAADKAGLKANDIVLAVAGKKTPDAEALARTVQRFNAGDTIELKVKRGSEELTLKATLGKRDLKKDLSEIQNNMGSLLSKRRGDYPVALQHDTVLRPTDCGGPLVDLEGNVVGLNISRYGRVETYAIPAEVVRTVLAELLASKRQTVGQKK